jgi:hypothetical protein
MKESSSYQISWDNLYNRKLNAVTTAASLMLAATTIAALSF